MRVRLNMWMECAIRHIRAQEQIITHGGLKVYTCGAIAQWMISEVLKC
jgi:hypothetical protein